MDGSWLWDASGTHIYSNTGMQLGANFWKGTLGLDLPYGSLVFDTGGSSSRAPFARDWIMQESSKEVRTVLHDLTGIPCHIGSIWGKDNLVSLTFAFIM